MSIVELRKKIKKGVENADEKTLKMLEALLTIEQEYDWWDEAEEALKSSIRRAQDDIESGNIIPHNEVMKKYKK